jgi:hypothetical protein
MTHVDPSKLVIAVSTHLRPVPLRVTVKLWRESCPDYRRMYVVVNHPDGAAGFEPPERCRIIHTGRVPQHPGCMSRTWNLAMQWAFQDPEVEWLLCSMDDVGVRQGWLDLVNRHAFQFYLAPCGDLVFLLHREVFRRVGWFDERFVVMGFQEWDWEARVLRALGVERVMMEDGHGWNHNAIGLHNYWFHTGDFAPTHRDTSCQMLNEYWLHRKWGLHATRHFVDMMASGVVRECPTPEIDWYPWFSRQAVACLLEAK